MSDINSWCGLSAECNYVEDRCDVHRMADALSEARAEVAEWRRLMARPHPGDPCNETHGLAAQDSCMGCERDTARAALDRLTDLDDALVTGVSEELSIDIGPEMVNDGNREFVIDVIKAVGLVLRESQ